MTSTSSALRVLILTRQYGGCGYYRQRVPARVLETYPDISVTHFDGELFHKVLKPATPRPPQPDWVTWLEDNIGQYDLLVFDRPTDHQTLAYIRGFVQNSPGCRLAIDFDDDFTRVPRGNPAHRFYTPGKECYEAGVASLRLAEAVSVSTEHLREQMAPLCHFIRKVPNMIDPADWEGFPVNPERAADPHVRILYSGAAGHYEDLDEIQEAFTELLTNPPLPLRLIIMGSSPVWLHDLSRKFPGRVVVLPWHPFPDYPPSVAWGGYDLAIAPLTDSTFNRSKCLVGSTRVVTPEGIQPLREVDSGKIWQGSSTGWRDIEASVCYLDRETIKVTTRLGYEIEGTPNHRVKTPTGWKRLDELGLNDSVCLDRFEFPDLPVATITGPLLLTKKLDSYNVDLDDNLAPHIHLNEEWARFFGLVLGDGCISSYNAVVVSCDGQDEEVLAWIENFADRIGVPVQRDYKTARAAAVRLSSRNLQWILRKAGFAGEGQTRKKRLRVPAFIWQSPKQVVAAFLQGLFEADGTVNAAGCSFTTKSEELAKEIQLLLLGFGILTNRRKSYNKKYRKNYWTVALRREATDIFHAEIGFMSPRKKLKLREVVGRAYGNAFKPTDWTDTITALSAGRSDVYDIQVPDGSYYLANGIVSHNSDIKILEAGLQHIPIVCSNIGPYRDVPSDCAFKVENTTSAWLEAMKIALTDPDLRQRVARRCNSGVKDCRTSSVLGYMWYDFVQEAYARPRIETLEDTRLPAEVEAAAAGGTT